MGISIQKPTVGGSADTWGTTINTGLDTIVDALNGTSGTVAPDLSTLTINGTDVTATAAEINTLGGLTATTAELNTLSGVTATTAEINLLEGVTATTAELNILTGVTATAAEINYVGGVTSSVQTQIDDIATPQDASAWEAGTDTTETVVSPDKIKAAIEALLVTDYTMNQEGYLELFMGFKLVWGTFDSTSDVAQAFTFHESFPNNCWGIAGDANGGFSLLSTTGFTFNRDNSYGGAVEFRYIAWGN